jgi:hypothetical protein
VRGSVPSARSSPEGLGRGAPRRGRLCALALVAAGPGCALGGAPGAALTSGDACLVGPAPGAVSTASQGGGGAALATARPVIVGVPGPIDPSHAPIPRTTAEALVFAQLYETLVELDCEGGPHAGLAETWSTSEGGRQWTFFLRSAARDWEGIPLTASSVASSWISALESLAREPGAGKGIPAFVSLAAMDSRTLRVTLPEPVEADLFARPELAVSTSRGPSSWPSGTGPYRPVAVPPDPDGSGQPPAGGQPVVRLTAVGRDGVEFRTVSGDLRDALDGGDEAVDLLVTSDPTIIDYARAAPAWDAFPLTWDRIYLLVVSRAWPRDEPGATGATRPGTRLPPAPVRAALARDAVRSDARAALDPAGMEACRPPPGRASGTALPIGPRTRRIVYPAMDEPARSLAERLVALALGPTGTDAEWLAGLLPAAGGGASPVRSVGLAPGAFAEALRAGRDAAYILPAERTPGRPCDLMASALALAPWLLAEPDSADGRGPALAPLVETRPTLVLRRGVAGARIDGNGALRLEGLVLDPTGEEP